MTESDRARDVADGTETDKLERWWPRALDGGGASPDELASGEVGFARGGGCGWRDEPLPDVGVAAAAAVGLRPVDAGKASGPQRATFRKVMVHLISSPAKTTCSCQRTKTRMLLVLLVLLLLLPEASGRIVDYEQEFPRWNSTWLDVARRGSTRQTRFGVSFSSSLSTRAWARARESEKMRNRERETWERTAIDGFVPCAKGNCQNRQVGCACISDRD